MNFRRYDAEKLLGFIHSGTAGPYKTGYGFNLMDIDPALVALKPPAKILGAGYDFRSRLEVLLNPKVILCQLAIIIRH